MVVNKKMRIVSEVRTQQELSELKSTMEIFIVSNRIKELANQI
jgi:hypothetical protein